MTAKKSTKTGVGKYFSGWPEYIPLCSDEAVYLMLEYCPAGRLWDVVKPLGELFCKFNLHCDPSVLIVPIGQGIWDSL